MEIRRPGAVPTQRANADYFTGTVWQDPLAETPEPAALGVVRVAFEPGARTVWHTHPLGQTLHVVSGLGLIQCEGEPAHAIQPGDTVWIPPHVRHWHGASPGSGMVHIAMHERLDGTYVTWREPVSDADYESAAGQASA